MLPITASNCLIRTLSVLALVTAPMLAQAAPSLDPAEFDPSIKVCTDLFGHVNAKWLAAHPIPSDRSSWGVTATLVEASERAQRDLLDELVAKPPAAGNVGRKLADFFASGMDEAAVEAAGYDPIKPELARIANLNTPEQLVAWITDAFAQGLGGPFEFAASPDFKNSSLNIAYANQGGLALPSRDHYFKPEHAAVRKAYVAYVTKLFELTGVPADEAARRAASVMAFETRLARASLTPVQLRDTQNQYHLVNLRQAAQLTPHLPWAKFFAAQQAKVTGSFSLTHPKFFAELDRMIASAPAAQWQAYLQAHVISDAAPALSSPFVQAQFDFYNRTLSGQTEMKPRWRRVLDATNDAMGMALGQLYVERHFPQASKTAAVQMVDNLRAAFGARIAKLEWMSPATKIQAQRKLAAFTAKVGYPDKWRDWSGLQIQAAGFYSNVASARRFNYAYEMSKIGQPKDRSEWFMTPQTVNAYYDAQSNEIVFPAAILQAPFFDANGDAAVNYGGMGATIGHEMSHGFDDEGSQFDAAGNKVEWWTKEDKRRFAARTKKLVEQFSAYEGLPGLKVNGQLTLGENIADLGGLNVALDGYRLYLASNPQDNKPINGYTPEQRFYLGYALSWREQTRPEALKQQIAADPHAPDALRAIGPPANMPEFAQAFSCKPGDAMVRDAGKQVVIW
jgi:putative endopeptidase